MVVSAATRASGTSGGSSPSEWAGYNWPGMERFCAYLLIGALLGCGGCGWLLDHEDNGPGPHCLDGQFFMVQAAVNHGPGPPPLTCVEMAPSHIQLTLSSSPPSPVPVNGLSCTDGGPYNLHGLTSGGIAKGTAVTKADLLANSDGTLLATQVFATDQQVRMASCTWASLTLDFGLP